MIRVTGSRLFLDSSVWLGYFLGNIPETQKIIDSEETTLFTSIISLHEVFKRLKKLGRTEKEIRQAVRLIEDNSIIVELNKEIAITAAKNCEKYGLHTIDSLIYSSAMETRTTFITADNDFRKTPRTRIIKIRKFN
ncbi:PIN domain-containing protein [Candidatus Micrarchaeota archaeon]|nr:PIN domain-containing protein [Candidatus Micrarchaeota archaeon]MBU1929872.1 PIN domain-containing protein [Candidatus Micrarchaeota archaeon]